MTHLGDITKINGSTVEPVNVIIGGSLCQDLSIAGGRAGLAGERSGLFMEQIRLIKEMRDADAARGRTGRSIRPRWMVWENVPGAFSSNKGADFAADTPGGAGEASAYRIGAYYSAGMLSPNPQAGIIPADISCTLDCNGGAPTSQQGGVCIVQRPLAIPVENHAQDSRVKLSEDGTVQTLSGKMGTGGGECSPDAPRAYCLRMRAGCKGGGKGALIQIEKSGTLCPNNDQTLFTIQGFGDYKRGG